MFNKQKKKAHHIIANAFRGQGQVRSADPLAVTRADERATGGGCAHDLHHGRPRGGGRAGGRGVGPSVLFTFTAPVDQAAGDGQPKARGGHLLPSPSLVHHALSACVRENPVAWPHHGHGDGDLAVLLEVGGGGRLDRLVGGPRAVVLRGEAQVHLFSVCCDNDQNIQLVLFCLMNLKLTIVLM